MKQHRAFYILLVVIVALSANFSWEYFHRQKTPSATVADSEAGPTPVARTGSEIKRALPGLLEDMVDSFRLALAGVEGISPTDSVIKPTPPPPPQEPEVPYMPVPVTTTGPTSQPVTEAAPPPVTPPPDTVVEPTPAPGTIPAPPPDTITGPTPAPSPEPNPSTEPSHEPEEDEEPEELESDSVSMMRSTSAPAAASLAGRSPIVLLGSFTWLAGLSQLDDEPGFRVFVRTRLGLNSAGYEYRVQGTGPPGKAALQSKDRTVSGEVASST